jgi:hypothetical protein
MNVAEAAQRFHDEFMENLEAKNSWGKNEVSNMFIKHYHDFLLELIKITEKRSDK